MEVGFLLLGFPMFEDITSLGIDEMPLTVPLCLCGLEADPHDRCQFWILVTLYTLERSKDVPDLFVFGGRRVRFLGPKANDPRYHPHIRWKQVLGAYDSGKKKGVVKLTESETSDRLDILQAITTNDIGTRRLLLEIGFLP
jgi:hypothetical protein